MQQRTVVVADDVVEIRTLVEKFLEPMGFKVLGAGTGREATKLLRNNRCDLLIADVLMPDGDGLEVITELKHTDGTVRILAISGGGGPLEADYCVKLAKALGAHATMTKPFDRNQLVNAVQSVLAA
jgi:CheY-like chemotaxis protein